MLAFTFVENEETIALFKFLVPELKLLKRKVIGDKVLMKSVQLLQDNIIKIAKDNIDRVTTTFDDWTNIRQEHIWAPISSDDKIVEQELTIIDSNYQVSDNEDKDNVEEATASSNENFEDENLITEDTDFGFGRREKHPADDESAKWSLDLLFISSLEKPLYFDSELTSNK
ncbi:3156_t:CDS:2 [Scutellospora calospora]|uniref:3156_t:CDS:1 n=1 Tax=Scutellospora calospora TaxID=85575 RepID=A0ACA9KVD7_9GLOM|nr:3156_t:CDS:2 [Scutellospora calospora]